MKPQELMINDFVFVDTLSEYGWIPTKVREVAEECILVNLGEGKEEVDNSAFKPIPLTAEILKNNGFTDVGDGYYQNEEQCCGVELLNTFMFYVYVNDYDNDECHDVAQVFYVHQLQHALRLVEKSEMADNLKI